MGVGHLKTRKNKVIFCGDTHVTLNPKEMKNNQELVHGLLSIIHKKML